MTAKRKRRQRRCQTEATRWRHLPAAAVDVVVVVVAAAAAVDVVEDLNRLNMRGSCSRQARLCLPPLRQRAEQVECHRGAMDAC